MNHHIRFLFGLIIILMVNVFLSACVQSTSASVSGTDFPVSTVQEEQPLHKAYQPGVATPSPTLHMILLKTQTAISIVPTADLGNKPTNTALVSDFQSKTEPFPDPYSTEYVFKICSPLTTVNVSDLSKIISAPYHPPPMGRDDRHQGVDFSYHHWNGSGPIRGVGVQAVLPGKVAASLKDTFPYGNLMMVETTANLLPEEWQNYLGITPEKSLYTLYAHLDGPPWVKLGQPVLACQLLGLVGNSGNAIVPHLHLETRIGPVGMVFTGLSRFTEEATELEKKNYILWRKSGEFIHFDPMKLFEIDPSP